MRKGVSKLVKTDVICGKAAAGQFERRQTEKCEAPRSIFSCELGERLVADPTFHRGGYLQLFCIENGDKKSLRAKVYYTDIHVYDIQYCSISDVCGHCFVKCKCKVMPSIANAKKNPDHDVWLCMSKVTGNVHSADCDCTAGYALLMNQHVLHRS